MSSCWSRRATCWTSTGRWSGRCAVQDGKITQVDREIAVQADRASTPPGEAGDARADQRHTHSNQLLEQGLGDGCHSICGWCRWPLVPGWTPVGCMPSPPGIRCCSFAPAARPVSITLGGATDHRRGPGRDHAGLCRYRISRRGRGCDDRHGIFSTLPRSLLGDEPLPALPFGPSQASIQLAAARASWSAGRANSRLQAFLRSRAPALHGRAAEWLFQPWPRRDPGARYHPPAGSTIAVCLPSASVDRRLPT